MNKIQIELGNIGNSCFVIMPFNTTFQTQYDKIIKPALKELNIQCVRGDEIYTKQRIVDDIWNSIRACRFVIAELTSKNPNVLYELGLAHAIGKPVVIITRNADDVPFDLKALRYLYYDVNDPFWGENLKAGIQNLIKKLLENPGIEKYLEGISEVGEMQFPEIKTAPVILQKKLQTIFVDGTWMGSYFDKYDGKKREIKMTLQINQDENILLGSCISSYLLNEKLTVVQQILNGTIKEDIIELHGVNYTFVERGNESLYYLDSFKMKLSDDKNHLSGTIVSDPSSTVKSDIVIQFKKI